MLEGPVVTYACEFDADNYDDNLYASYGISLPRHIERSARRRKAEYLAGRCMARAGLAALGISHGDVHTSVDRAPCWPHGIVGSITHTHRYALCSVASSSRFHAIGIDIEHIVSPSSLRGVDRMVLSLNEASYLRFLGLPDEFSFTLGFSAKEALFKALYPHVKNFFDFDAARIVKVDPENKTFSLCLTQKLAEDWPRSSNITGRYNILPDRILTSIAIRT
jgi:4'-phosphopantetheinyl transferase EntD